MRKLAALAAFALHLPGVAGGRPAPHARCPAEPAEVIFRNGQVETLDETLSRAEAVAVKKGRILGVGSDARILRSFRGCGTKVVDLGGQVVLPAYVEPHSHGFASVRWLDEEPPSDEVIRQRQLFVQRTHLAAGIASQGELLTSRQLLHEMEAMDAEGQLIIRTSLYMSKTGACGELADHQAGVTPIDDPKARLRVPGAKIFADGAGTNACGQWAATTFPLVGIDPPPEVDPFYGDLFFTQDEMDTMIMALDAEGRQIAVHTIGDRARDEVLASYDLVLPGDGTNIRRHRIEHNNWTRLDQIAEYVRLGIVPTVFGLTATCLINEGLHIIVASAPDLGWYQPYRTMWAAGIRLAWHGDWNFATLQADAEPERIMGRHLSGLVTRRAFLDGEVCEPPAWFAAEAVTIEQAMRMVTINAAYALGTDTEVGSIERGKRADMIIVSDDPLTMAAEDLIDLSVRVTFVDGVARSCAAGYEGYCASP